MSNAFTNFLNGAVNGSGNLRDYQHASRLYTTNNYELAPKAGWLYYVVINVNPNIVSAITNPIDKSETTAWLNRYKGSIGLLAKSVDLPKFTVQTETLNQYNKKTVIQKQITYSPISMTLHDDSANATTDFWKHYYKYYFADSVTSGNFSAPTAVNPKYKDLKYAEYVSQLSNQYGLNNNQSVPFILSIDIYQLNQKKFTGFKIVNPLIKEWAHDQLDQSQGNKLLTSKMTLEYETVIYNTSPSNRITMQNPGFQTNHYDTTPSPLSIGGRGTTSILGPGGLLSGATDIFGSLQNLDSMSPLDMLNTAIKGANLVKNAKNISLAGIKQEGYSILGSTLGNIASSNATVENPDGTLSKQSLTSRVSQGISSTVSGINQAVAPAGINLFTGNNSSTSGIVQAVAKKIT